MVSKREIYANFIVYDKLFEQEEQWLDECQNFFLKIDIEAKCYVETVSGTASYPGALCAFNTVINKEVSY